MIKIPDLAKTVAKKHGKPQKEVTAFLNTLVDVLLDGLQQEKVVKIKGLGTFKVTTVKDRTSVNVNSGEPVIIEGHDKISFVPDTAMKDLVNKPFSQFETVPVNDGVEFEDIETTTETENIQDAENTEEQMTTDVPEHFELTTAEVQAETVAEEQAVVDQLSALADMPEDKPGEEAVTEAQKVSEEAKGISDIEGNTEALPQNSHDMTDDAENEFNTEEKNNEEENEEDMKKISWIKLLLAALLIALVAFALGYLIGQKTASQTTEEAPTPSAVAVKEVKDSLNEETPMSQQESAQREAATNDMSQLSAEELERANQKVSYGAYRIVGVERIVTARAGQSLKAISDANLGPGAEVYVKALNEDVTTVTEGQKIRIPKVELKKKSTK